jgi:hypothetical protein
VTAADPQVIAVAGSGGVRDGGDDPDRWPDGGRWISYADVRVSARVTSVQLSNRRLCVPWHGHVLLVWLGVPPRVVAHDSGGRALGEVFPVSTG